MWDSAMPSPRKPRPKNGQEFLISPPVSLLAYCPETTIAEKFHAAVVLETANSRMKDFFDIYWLSCHQSFQGKRLYEAIVATFERRSTEIPTTTPIALTSLFYSLPDKQLQWTGFLRKSKLEPLDFEAIMGKIADFLLPVVKDGVEDHEWHPETGWTKISS